MKRNYVYGLIIMVMIVILTACNGEKSAKSYHRTGMKQFKEGNYKEAKENLLKAVSAKPDKAEYYIDYGFVLIKTDKLEEAQIQFDQAIINKNNKVVRENNKKAHRGKGIAYYMAGDYEKAILEFEEAFMINEKTDMNQDISYYKGFTLEKSGNYEEALAHYNTMLESMKPNAYHYGLIGRMQYNIGNYDSALESYDKAIKFDKDAYEYYIEKYAILLEKGEMDSANEVLSQAFSIKAKTKEDNYHLGKLHYLSGDYDMAEPLLKESTEKEIIDAYYYLGEIAREKEDYLSAISYYKEYLQKEKDIKIITVYNQLTLCLMKNEEYEEALGILTIGLKQKDASILKEMLYNEVVVLEELSEFEEAYEKAKEYVEFYPEDKEMIREVEFLNTRVKKK